MAYYESLVELIGNTPLVKLGRVTAGIDATVLAKVEYFNPGGSVKDRIAVRMIDAAEQSGQLRAGGTIIEPDVRQHRNRPGDRGPTARLPLHLRLPGQGERRQDQHAPGVRSRGRRLSDRGVAGRSSLVLLRLRSTGPRYPGRMEARSVRESEQPALALRDHRPRAVGTDRRSHHALRRRRRHRRDDHRRRALPQGAVGRARADHAAPTPRARSIPVAPAVHIWSRASARISGRALSTAR